MTGSPGTLGGRVRAGGRKRRPAPRRALIFFALLVAALPVTLHIAAGSSYVDTPADNEPISPVPPTPKLDPRKLDLGARLFHDPDLSGDGKRACSSCHDTETNGADALRFDRSPAGPPLALHTNSVFNAALSFRLDWEGNARSLEDQAAMSLSDPSLMGSSIDGAVHALKGDEELKRLFIAAYGREPDRSSLLDAIATYERSLVTPGSRFDRWLQGDNNALSPQEQAGYELFKSFGCVSCHQGVNLGGNLFERAGIYHRLGWAQGQLLRVPSLRNIAVMAPYFHDGSVSSLATAVSEMGYAQLDRTLSGHQISAIVAFLGSLTGSYKGRALTSAK
jgi:cytochrome c peroxidase